MNAEVKGPPRQKLVEKFASKYNLEPNTLLTVLKSTAFRMDGDEVSNEQMAALLIVADQYNLNPFTKELYAYPDKHKGIVPVVSIDGWVRIINEHPQYNGYELQQSERMVISEKSEHPPCFEWISIQYFRKGIEHTPVLTEFFDEVYRPPIRPRGKDYTIDTAWQTHPKRFLRHKTMIQGARVVFGFAGLYDDDEAQRIIEQRATVVDTAKPRTQHAADALAERLAVTDKRDEDNPLNHQSSAREKEKAHADHLKTREREEQQLKSRSAEWDPPARGDDTPKGPAYKFDVASALALLREQRTTADLKDAYAKVVEDYEFSSRELPIDVEAIYRDLKEALEQREARK